MEVVVVGGFQPEVVAEAGVVTALASAFAVVFITRPSEAATVATDEKTVDDLVAVNGASRNRATSRGAVPNMAPAFRIECCLMLSKHVHLPH